MTPPPLLEEQAGAKVGEGQRQLPGTGVLVTGVIAFLGAAIEAPVAVTVER
jgi:hypothetical protein